MSDRHSPAFESFSETIGLIDIPKSVPAVETVGIFTRLLDQFTRVIFNIRSGIFEMLKSVRRSELKALHESYRLQMAEILQEAQPLTTTVVAIPIGMKVPYIDALAVLKDLQKEIAVEKTLEILEGFFRSREDFIKNNRLASPASILEVEKKIHLLDTETVEKRLGAVFAKDGNGEVVASTVVKRSQDLIQINSDILAMEPIILKAPLVAARAEAISKTVSAVIQSVENGTLRADADALRALQQLIYRAAEQLDLYGVILYESLRVEHNAVLMFRRFVELNQVTA